MRRQQKGIDGNNSEKEIDCEAGLLKLFPFVGYRNRSVDAKLMLLLGSMKTVLDCEDVGSMKMVLGNCFRLWLYVVPLYFFIF
jgi:hypothetical protein